MTLTQPCKEPLLSLQDITLIMEKQTIIKYLHSYGFPLFWLGYLAAVKFTTGWRAEHFALAILMLSLFYAHAKTRQWVLDFFPFACFGILYDFLRIYPTEWAGTIRIQEPFDIEVTLFRWLGFGDNFLPTEFFSNHTHIFLDIITGLAYGAHIIIPVSFALILWWRRSRFFDAFRWGFFALNIFAFITYIGYPAAPPWYVSDYGFEFLGWDVPSSSAGLIRFDTFFNTNYFQETYARNSWVFGAIPSMHAGWPLFVALFASRTLKWGRWVFYSFAALESFAAVYLNHHYVIDLLIGWAYAIAFYKVFCWCLTGEARQHPAVETVHESKDLTNSISIHNL